MELRYDTRPDYSAGDMNKRRGNWCSIEDRGVSVNNLATLIVNEYNQGKYFVEGLAKHKMALAELKRKLIRRLLIAEKIRARSETFSLKRDRTVYVDPKDVQKIYEAGKCIGGVQISTGLPVEYGGIGAMSKSKNNGVPI